MPRTLAALLSLTLLAAGSAPAQAQAPAFLFAFGSAGTAAGQFQLPHGLAIAPDGSIYVGDTANNRVQKFGPSGNYVAQWAAGTPGGVAVDASGNLVVID